MRSRYFTQPKRKVKSVSLDSYLDSPVVKPVKRTRGTSSSNSLNPWLFNDVPLTVAPDGFYGFVYEITNLKTGKRYIGKKFFWSVSGTGKKAVTKESNWKSYWSSSENIKNDIQLYGKDNLVRKILILCRDKRDVDLQEVRMLWTMNVLGAKNFDGEPIYYNDNISGKYYRRAELFDDNARLYADGIS